MINILSKICNIIMRVTVDETLIAVIIKFKIKGIMIIKDLCVTLFREENRILQQWICESDELLTTKKHV